MAWLGCKKDNGNSCVLQYVTSHDNQGSQIDTVTYQYDNNGRLLQYSRPQRGSRLGFSYQFQYNSDGYISQQTYTSIDSGNSFSYTLHYVYNNVLGRIYISQNYPVDTALAEQKYTYSNGKMLRWDFCSTITGQVTSYWLYSNYVGNNATKRSNYLVDGSSPQNSILQEEDYLEYDNNPIANGFGSSSSPAYAATNNTTKDSFVLYNTDGSMYDVKLSTRSYAYNQYGYATDVTLHSDTSIFYFNYLYNCH